MNDLWSGPETARARRLREAGSDLAQIAVMLGRSPQAVRTRLAATQHFWSRQEPSIEPPDPAIEAALLARIKADGGFPRLELVHGEPVWVWPFRVDTQSLDADS